MAIPTLKELRIKKELSMERLAADLGVSFRTIDNWESGRVDPMQMTFSKAVLLSDILDITLEYLCKVLFSSRS